MDSADPNDLGVDLSVDEDCSIEDLLTSLLNLGVDDSTDSLSRAPVGAKRALAGEREEGEEDEDDDDR